MIDILLQQMLKPHVKTIAKTSKHTTNIKNSNIIKTSLGKADYDQT
jgi:hypothetical protein